MFVVETNRGATEVICAHFSDALLIHQAKPRGTTEPKEELDAQRLKERLAEMIRAQAKE